MKKTIALKEDFDWVFEGMKRAIRQFGHEIRIASRLAEIKERVYGKYWGIMRPR